MLARGEGGEERKVELKESSRRFSGKKSVHRRFFEERSLPHEKIGRKKEEKKKRHFRGRNS